MEERVDKIYTLLLQKYPDATCTLNAYSPEFFLFSNILSPQCTDRVANTVSRNLWEKYMNVKNVAGAEVFELSQVVKPCGLHNVKSQNIKRSAQLLKEKYNSKLPNTIEKLRQFPGIGRKTALVILNEIFRRNEGIVIDTHNIRVASRIGLTDSKDAVKVEKDLMKVVPKDKWRMWSHLMVAHGRTVCVAQKPRCSSCPIRDLCEYGLNIK